LKSHDLGETLVPVGFKGLPERGLVLANMENTLSMLFIRIFGETK